MSDSNVIKLTQPGAFSDSLTEILRNGARALLGQAIEAEVAEFLAKHADLKKAPLRPSGTAPSDQKAACRTRPRSPWSSSSSKAPRKLGAASTDTTSCQN